MNYTMQTEPGIRTLPRDQADFFFAGITYLSWIIGSCIFSGIMLLVGGHRSPWSRFQVAQCFVSQIAFSIILGCCGGGIMAVFMIGMGAVVPMAGPPGGGGSGAAPAGAVAVGGLMFVFWFAFVLVAAIVPWVVGIWGMVTVFQGKDFVVPIVGPWVFNQFFQQYAYLPQPGHTFPLPGAYDQPGSPPALAQDQPPQPSLPPHE